MTQKEYSPEKFGATATIEFAQAIHFWSELVRRGFGTDTVKYRNECALQLERTAKFLRGEIPAVGPREPEKG